MTKLEFLKVYKKIEIKKSFKKISTPFSSSSLSCVVEKIPKKLYVHIFSHIEQRVIISVKGDSEIVG